MELSDLDSAIDEGFEEEMAGKIILNDDKEVRGRRATTSILTVTAACQSFR